MGEINFFDKSFCPYCVQVDFYIMLNNCFVDTDKRTWSISVTQGDTRTNILSPVFGSMVKTPTLQHNKDLFIGILDGKHYYHLLKGLTRR